jgi:hypothetical protein
MAQPTVDSIAQKLYKALEPMAWDDSYQGWALLHFLAAGGATLQDIEDMVRTGSNGEPGWSSIVDLARVPDAAIPWLGQFVGVEVDTNLSITSQKEQILAHLGWQRGTRASMIAAAQQYLTGNKLVTFQERDTSAYHLLVVTYTSETPDQSAVLAALISQKPAGIVMVYEVRPGQSYQQLRDTHTDYLDVRNDYATYEDCRDDLPI